MQNPDQPLERTWCHVKSSSAMQDSCRRLQPPRQALVELSPSAAVLAAAVASGLQNGRAGARNDDRKGVGMDC